MLNVITQILPWAQVLLVVLMTAGILLQPSEAGLGSAFGGSGDADMVGRTRRGVEKTLFNATIVMAVLFVAVSIAAVVL